MLRIVHMPLPAPMLHWHTHLMDVKLISGPAMIILLQSICMYLVLCLFIGNLNRHLPMGRYQCAEDLMKGPGGKKGAIKGMAMPLFGAAHVVDAEHGDGQPLKLELQVKAIDYPHQSVQC